MNDPADLPLTLLAPGDGAEPVIVEVAMPGGATLSAQVWVASVGRIPLLLLDSDIDRNDDQPEGAALRAVTDRLREPAGLAPQVLGITGMAGIGKTSLALRVAK